MLCLLLSLIPADASLKASKKHQVTREVDACRSPWLIESHTAHQTARAKSTTVVDITVEANLKALSRFEQLTLNVLECLQLFRAAFMEKSDCSLRNSGAVISLAKDLIYLDEELQAKLKPAFAPSAALLIGKIDESLANLTAALDGSEAYSCEALDSESISIVMSMTELTKLWTTYFQDTLYLSHISNCRELAASSSSLRAWLRTASLWQVATPKIQAFYDEALSFSENAGRLCQSTCVKSELFRSGVFKPVVSLLDSMRSVSRQLRMATNKTISGFHSRLRVALASVLVCSARLDRLPPSDSVERFKVHFEILSGSLGRVAKYLKEEGLTATEELLERCQWSTEGADRLCIVSSSRSIEMPTGFEEVTSGSA